MSKVVVLNQNLKDVAIRPTKKNPDIKVKIGWDGKSYKPKAIYYPDSFADQDISNKVRRFMAMSESKGCPVCQRYAAEQTAKSVFVGLGIALALLVGVALYMKKVDK